VVRFHPVAPFRDSSAVEQVTVNHWVLGSIPSHGANLMGDEYMQTLDDLLLQCAKENGIDLEAARRNRLADIELRKWAIELHASKNNKPFKLDLHATEELVKFLKTGKMPEEVEIEV
jgi:hypothetical protein